MQLTELAQIQLICAVVIIVKSKLKICFRLFVVALSLCLGSAGVFAQANLFSNGSFDAANGISSWTTQYTTNTVTTTGRYVIAASPAAAGFTVNTNNIGAQNGANAMWVNGASAAGTTNIVSQSVTVSASTTYTFRGRLVSAESPVNQAATIKIYVTSNGVTTSSGTFTATTSWQEIYYTFTTPAGATSATIVLIDTNTNNTGTGNDFGLDNLSVPEPSTYAAGLFVVGAGFFAWRRQRRKAQSVA